MNYEEFKKQIDEQRKAYTGFAITNEEKRALPIGTHYFKAIFDDTEGLKDTIGYYRTFKEAAKAAKAFAKIELEMFYAEEFDINEYEVSRDEEGNFKGKLIAKYTNDLSFKFTRYQ